MNRRYHEAVSSISLVFVRALNHETHGAAEAAISNQETGAAGGARESEVPEGVRSEIEVAKGRRKTAGSLNRLKSYWAALDF
jgi:hypothetical protein